MKPWSPSPPSQDDKHILYPSRGVSQNTDVISETELGSGGIFYTTSTYSTSEALKKALRNFIQDATESDLILFGSALASILFSVASFNQGTSINFDRKRGSSYIDDETLENTTHAIEFTSLDKSLNTLIEGKEILQEIRQDLPDDILDEFDL